MNAIESVVELVHSRGASRDDCRLIASYVADRCVGLSIASLHSSSHSALHRDPFLTRQMCLNPRQVRAWLSLIRGTRAVYRNGRTYGGRRGFIEAVSMGPITDAEKHRFERLAYVAATGRLAGSVALASGCTRRDSGEA